MMSWILHMTAPPQAFFLGQVRRYGAQTWETVTGKCTTPEGAMRKALLAMNPNDHRARAIWVTSCGWYEPKVVLEASR